MVQPDLRLDNAWGYCEAADAKAFERDKYRALTSALLNAPDVQGYCYTQLTDVGTGNRRPSDTDKRGQNPT